MLSTRKRLATVIAAIGVLAIVAPVASSSAQIPGFPLPAGVAPLGVTPLGGNVGGAFGPCARTSSEQQGGTAATDPQICLGAGLAFVGPAVGQVASVIGPTSIGPVSIGSSVVGAGDVAGGVG